MIKKLLSVLLISLAASTAVHAAPKMLPKDSLICASEEAYDTQIKYLANDIKKYAPGCGAAKKNFQVVIIDLNILSASEVQVIETGTNIWVSGDALK
ncbi:hypothetical protein ABQX22_00530 [Xanthomonas sp. WHRI 1810A]|uniref:hypothetical protein n=1 Tax=Xanthomonas sp. WHRI 1810A TaxID=3161565 RepID=UPI0032E8A736